MKIAVNTRFLLKGKLEGIGMYTHEIFKRVAQLLPEHQFYFLFDRKWDEAFITSENIIPIKVNPQARHPFLWYWWFEHSIPKILKQNNIDLFISPDGFGSLSTEVPQLITIHDLGFEHYPQHVPYLVNKFYTHYSPLYCRKAATILAVSEFTKQDIIKQYGIRPSKIEVIYNGVDIDTPKLEKVEPKRERPYFIFVGAVHPRKNVLGLLKAFERFKAKYPGEQQLIIIGRKAWMNSALEEFYSAMEFKAEVVWIEKIERKDLLQLLKHAIALVYPSLFEGFGIPIIESMGLGVPVISSSVSALPEIAGNSALMIDPNNPDDICDAMQTILTDNVLRNQLVENGKKRAAQFSWEVSAKKIVALINKHIQ